MRPLDRLATAGSPRHLDALDCMDVSSDIDAHVRAFIAERIDSVAALDVLLLLYSRPQHGWTAQEIAAELRIDAAWAADQLADTARRALATQTGDTYRYAPATPALEMTVRDLARAYAERRVNVIALIFSKPSTSLRNFADAFRLRKDKTDG